MAEEDEEEEGLREEYTVIVSYSPSVKREKKERERHTHFSLFSVSLFSSTLSSMIIGFLSHRRSRVPSNYHDDKE